MNDVDWIDLPKGDYVAILGYETSNTLALTQKVQAYHLLQKSEKTRLLDRITHLNGIVSFVTTWIEERLEAIDKRKHLNWIIDIATKKRNYLKALYDIYSTNKHSIQAQEAYHTKTSLQNNSEWQVITLSNHRFFSLKMREFWGDFWFESLDPCHRRLTPFLEQWEKVKDPPHFFLWLEEQQIPKYVPRVTYLEEEERKNAKLSIVNGLICDKNQKPIDFSNKKARLLFSIDLDKNIYAAEEGNGISHSSFTSGRPVLGAGLLFVDKGELLGIALESGHYMPTTQIGFQILTLLREKSVKFPEKLELIFFYDRNKYSAFLTQTDLQEFSLFERALQRTYESNLLPS